MLSVNKSFGFLILSTCFFPAYADNILSYDIKRIKLGMSKNKVMKIMPCHNPDTDIHDLANGIVLQESILCSRNNKADFFRVDLDHNQHVMRVYKRVTFEVKPDVNTIKRRLIEKYGKPNGIAKQVPGYANDNTGYDEYFCWGRCNVKYIEDKHFKGSKISYGGSDEPWLYVWYSDFYVTDSGRHTNQIVFTLNDTERVNNNYEWRNKQQVIWERQKKDNASNIDF